MREIIPIRFAEGASAYVDPSGHASGTEAAAGARVLYGNIQFSCARDIHSGRPGLGILESIRIYNGRFGSLKDCLVGAMGGLSATSPIVIYQEADSVVVWDGPRFTAAGSGLIALIRYAGDGTGARVESLALFRPGEAGIIPDRRVPIPIR